MEIEIKLVEGPIALREREAPPSQGIAGAQVVFEGLVRADESGRILAALDYEAYEPMASRGLGSLVRGLAAKHSGGKGKSWP